jgi:outer membrane protein OmpA-like peptidoglycan-associated protein
MRTFRAAALTIACAGTVLPATASWAQSTTRSGEFSVQGFLPAPGTGNFLQTEGARMDGNWAFTAGIFGNYAKNPFVVLTCTSPTLDCNAANATNKTRIPVVSDMFTADLLGSVSPTKWLQLGLRLPLSYVNGQGVDLTTGTGQQGALKKFGVGDPQIEGKLRLLGKAKDPVVLGAAADLSFPVGHLFSNQAAGQDYYLGNSSPVTGGVRGILDVVEGPWQLGLNVRGVFRETAQLATTKVGPVDFRYSGAVGFRISPIFRLMAEGAGTTQFNAGPTNTFEADGALELSPLDARLVFKAGGGAGVLQGIGAPQGRAFLGVMYAYEVHDTDRDGIPDDVDKCPTIPEDFDGFEDHDGCPDPDNDGDMIPDAKDLCPNEPETINGYQDTDGCPDEVPDRDHDGIPDSADKCPDAGGPDIIRNPKSPYYGCPDRDHDGVPDHLDKCPDVPEPTDDLWDGSGCPHVRDTDHDGIPDDVDQCPTQPETYNGFQDADGCPDKGPTVVELSETAIKVQGRVEFATGKDKIDGAKSFQVLDAVAGVMGGHKDILLVEVQGHTDGAGVADQNRKLSQKRAEAVVKYLTTKGVDAARLTAKGYGPDVPVADNKTPAGRQKNRRVDFVILKTAPRGKAAAAAAQGGLPATPPSPAVPQPPPPRPDVRPKVAPPKK